MELRVLKYFTTVVDEGSISNAAKALHITQPTLSRQLAQMEQEMGRPLFERRHGGVELTETGITLNRYARRLLELADKTKEEVAAPTESVSGTVHIGAGETKAMNLLGEAMIRVRKRFPNVTFDLHDGTADSLMDDFLHGYFDVLLECGLQPHSGLNVLELPVSDVYGVYARPESPLAKLDVVTVDDLVGTPLIIPDQHNKSAMRTWAGDRFGDLTVVSTCNLILNAQFVAEAGLGALIGFGGLTMDRGSAQLTFRELSPRVEARNGLLWRKVRPTKQTQVFLDEVQKLIAE